MSRCPIDAMNAGKHFLKRAGRSITVILSNIGKVLLKDLFLFFEEKNSENVIYF